MDVAEEADDGQVGEGRVGAHRGQGLDGRRAGAVEIDGAESS